VTHKRPTRKRRGRTKGEGNRDQILGEGGGKRIKSWLELPKSKKSGDGPNGGDGSNCQTSTLANKKCFAPVSDFGIGGGKPEVDPRITGRKG